MTALKAITVKQPWASALLLLKNVENRTQMFGYRGPLAIHAAKVDDEGGYGDARIKTIAEHGHPQFVSRDLPRGAVVGVVDLVDCHWHRLGCCGTPWATTEAGVTHLVRESPRCIATPVPARGFLGLWDLPADVADQVISQLGGRL